MAGIDDINWLYAKYYSDNPELRRIVTVHSELVAKKALEICNNKNIGLAPEKVYCAAMLHDIGVVRCYAPEMGAHGSLPYILHGIEGAKILEENGLTQFSRICLSHTGAGLTKKEIINQNLPLPHYDFLPETLLEKLICYSDKFFSKSKKLTHQKTLDEINRQMKRFGEDSFQRFQQMHLLFQT